MAKVLIVDDDEDLLQLMELVLQDAGFETGGATSGKAALERMEAGCCDLLITDIMMPDVNGLDIIDTALAKNPDTTILAVSSADGSDGDENMLEAAMMSGADAVLGKPFDPGELVRTAKALLR